MISDEIPNCETSLLPKSLGFHFRHSIKGFSCTCPYIEIHLFQNAFTKCVHSKISTKGRMDIQGESVVFCVCVCVCVLNQTPFVENNSFQRPHTPILQPSSVAKNEIPRTCNAADFCLCTTLHCSHCLPPSLSGFASCKREWPLVKSSFV